MALIKAFERKDLERNKVHDPIEASFTSFTDGDRKFVQIDTHGRPTREMPGKKSQTIQLDEAGARALVDILQREFDL
ncbi:MAG: methionyl-tRNA formyltransferase [Hyphomonadaceae bacterium]